MDESLFVQKISSLLYKTQKEEVGLQTPFKKLQEWNLLFATSYILLVKEEYDISIQQKELAEADTLGDLYAIIKNARKSAGHTD